MIPVPTTILLPRREELSDAERIASARAFADELSQRRTVRDYASTPVPREVIEMFSILIITHKNITELTTTYAFVD